MRVCICISEGGAEHSIRQKTECNSVRCVCVHSTKNTKHRDLYAREFSRHYCTQYKYNSAKHNTAESESITNRSKAYQWRLPNLIHPRALLAQLGLVPAEMRQLNNWHH